jgi:mannose-6-phosphate isomerase-like protein (cupin superfamily)
MSRYVVEKFAGESIACIANHFMADGIDRLVVNSMPMHCAIHKIDVVQNQQEYSSLHGHEDEDELNIIINDKGHELLYRFVVDGEEFELSAPACVWVPAQISHNANVIQGRGTFVCMRFPKKFAATEKPAI